MASTMHASAQARTYDYVPRSSTHKHTASASASYPYATHRPPPEGLTNSSSRTVSPSVLRRTRPRAGTSTAAVPPHNASATGLGARNAGPYSNVPYKTSAGASVHDASPSRPRAHSHSQNSSRTQPYTQTHTRSRSTYQQTQTQMNSYPYASKPTAGSQSTSQRQYFPGSTYTYPSEDGRVMLDMDAFRRNLEREGPPVSHNSYGAHANPHISGIPDIEWRRPAPGEVPLGYEDYIQPVARGPPGGGWPMSSGSSHATHAQYNYGRHAYPPPRPPSPASHYPFASYKPPGDSDRRDNQTRDRRQSNARDGHPPPMHAAAASQADSTASDPLIHNALGWWPELRRPALYWDLSSNAPPRYTKRQFDAEELAASPFTPPLSRMRLVLDSHVQWAFDLSAPRGQRYITLSSLLSDIAKLMHAPNMVPHVFWTRASTQKKEAVLRAMIRRTGRPLPTQPPHRRPKPRGQIMEEAVVDGAPNGYTNLKVIDLLCDDVMFSGMEFHKGPDEWVLRTTRRY
ncbi:uncharacterized protein FOMMEDRAFT_142783 [Fomitiporia mediterranea MF3/22]|uniref:uncharacterized protein n=1 Tax=Fomitiporia mediterranea (strain MF3/22) TaxID=694068 RepID=UPI00044079BC|nr:uncharacterized protein FOMMEDRAFT_142783 [Fomitiporia mediterranea MF3/22]EJC99122.1 hypothetical protein FOMMEDRAFT_142783 [Fomitiporia mediterranea MF3/22]